MDDKGALRNPSSDHEFESLELSALWDDSGKHANDDAYAYQVSYRDLYRRGESTFGESFHYSYKFWGLVQSQGSGNVKLAPAPALSYRHRRLSRLMRLEE